MTNPQTELASIVGFDGIVYSVHMRKQYLVYIVYIMLLLDSKVLKQLALSLHSKSTLTPNLRVQFAFTSRLHMDFFHVLD